jgi:DNA modification methylase
MGKEYQEFLKAKVRLAQSTGFAVEDHEINTALKPHNKLMVKWLVSGGRRGCFASFGLHKTVTQLETIRITLTKTGGRGLIICPLGVRQEFIRDAKELLKWHVLPKFIRRIEEAGDTGIYLTNYETVRDGKLDPRLFQVASLDEASVLRGFGGTKTFREFMRLFTGDAGPLGDRRGKDCVPYRFVATATPSPNDYIELLAYADFLGIMDVSQAKTRFFKRDSTKADKLTLHAHKEEEFWLWVASWALFVTKPSDLTGNASDDEGYILPELDIRWHELPSDHTTAGTERNGQGLLFKTAALGLDGASREKRESLDARVVKVVELREEDPAAHRVIWHDLESERYLIEKLIPGCATVFGKQDLEEREEIIRKFSNGEIPEIAGKPCMIGSGTNLQKYCHWAIYTGIGFKFNDFIQSIHRLLRFLQTHQVRIDLIYTEAEREIRKQLERKWAQHNQLVKNMTDIIKRFGLSEIAMAQTLTRKMGVERVEVKGNNYTIVNNDCVVETRRLDDNSVGLILTSIPFSTQYEYSPNYADFGHTENNEEFFEQMDYLTPELFRCLKPGRIAAIHVKDRIVPGGMTGLGFQTVYPFHLHTIEHYRRHGFAYIGMKTIVTDVVRENKQTYRLGWTEQCKDGSKMGVGMPEYLLLFRKPPSDTSNAYADEPVVKQKPLQVREDGTTQPFNRDENLPLVPRSGYSRSRWQVDAHGFARSAGDRLMDPEELQTLDHDIIFKLFKQYSLETVYDFEHHVTIGETLEGFGRMPSSFMLLQPQSWSDEVWTDITRMLTLNGSQWSKGKEMHLCPMQFDIADRVIEQMSNEGDIVLDPFGGLMTVPFRAILKKRYGIAFELNHSYFIDGATYCKAAESKKDMPSLFDTLNEAV